MDPFPVSLDEFVVLKRNDGRKLVVGDRIVIIGSHDSVRYGSETADYMAHLDIRDISQESIYSSYNIADDECQSIIRKHLRL